LSPNIVVSITEKQPIQVNLITAALPKPYVDVRDYSSFAAAITAIGSLKKTLLIPNEQAISGSIAVPSNIGLWFLEGGSLAIATGATVTINGHVEAGLFKIFSCSGTGKVLFGKGGVSKILTSWWGVTGIGDQDDALAIQAAIDSAPEDSFVYSPGPSTKILSALQLRTKGLHIKISGLLTLGTDGVNGFELDYTLPDHLSRIIIELDHVVGNGLDKGQTVVLIKNAMNNTFYIWRVDNVGVVAKPQGSSTEGNGENVFFFLMWHTCDKPIYFPSTATAWAEGWGIYGGMIADSNYGILFENGAYSGGCSFIGCIDNVSRAGSFDYINNLAGDKLGNLLLFRFVRPDKCVFSPKDHHVAPPIAAPQARAYRNGSQQNTTTGWKKVQLNAESYDPGGRFDSATNFRYLAPESGRYHVTGTLTFVSVSAQSDFSLALYKNGSIVTRFARQPLLAASSYTLSGSDIIELVAGDYLELWFYTPAADGGINGGAFDTFLAIDRVGG
jgi:hypothetical protein